eukprot:TRINITY_DN1232_c0_g3_i3.p1 TRINITY_DN1232_c0_g3~~TRINITY_DN1232_c0_g3_i3.p1  ORF type:complete len:304 (+),score=54.06 TRINITY_DN1232_c0_g3_i3:156-1067(+)
MDFRSKNGSRRTWYELSYPSDEEGSTEECTADDEQSLTQSPELSINAAEFVPRTLQGTPPPVCTVKDQHGSRPSWYEMSYPSGEEGSTEEGIAGEEQNLTQSSELSINAAEFVPRTLQGTPPPVCTVKDQHRVHNAKALLKLLTLWQLSFSVWEQIRKLCLEKLNMRYVELPNLLELLESLTALPEAQWLWNDELNGVREEFQVEWDRFNELWEAFVQAYKQSKDEWESVPKIERTRALTELARSPSFKRLIGGSVLPELPQLSLPHPGGPDVMTKSAFQNASNHIRAWMHGRQPAQIFWKML